LPIGTFSANLGLRIGNIWLQDGTRKCSFEFRKRQKEFRHLSPAFSSFSEILADKIAAMSLPNLTRPHPHFSDIKNLKFHVCSSEQKITIFTGTWTKHRLKKFKNHSKLQ